MAEVEMSVGRIEGPLPNIEDATVRVGRVPATAEDPIGQVVVSVWGRFDVGTYAFPVRLMLHMTPLEFERVVEDAAQEG